ncbi:DUF4327 family protein [Chrysosporum bergii ANA360D]|jgi:hypothetical protein|uniref:DUF4327 family protein n=1 Tax=Chrysosporum bergii ANA360D TaxID=617107 RepID=A0AA43GR26_9CYAN|nr:DUF4327 family protein [Chrysosporum bergii]MDH6060173.1 DUF4327 family protein [Chrysosporum bergii ANA360D]
MDTAVKYHIGLIREEARQLVQKGLIDRQKPIYSLCKYVPNHDWILFELELERNEFLLRDRIIDLLSSETWEED